MSEEKVKCEKCGKYLSEETKRKISDAMKGENNPNFGKHFSEKHRRKISMANKGKTNSEEARKKISESLKGKHHSEEQKRKISQSLSGRVLSEETKRRISNARKGGHISEGQKVKLRELRKGKRHTEETKRKISEASKGRQFSEETRKKLSEANKNPSEETRRKMSEARMRRKGFPQHHTKPELIFEEICKKYNLPYRYTGDGAFWIGKNPSVNPDFVECNGKKIAVEIFSYWHDPLRRHCKVRYSQTYEGRKKILKKYGWALIVFWEDDLKREGVEQFVLSTLNREGIVK